MTIQSNNNNVSYLINPTFTKVNRLFILSFERIAGENNTTRDHRDSFTHYFVPDIKIKDFNVFNWWKGFFDLPLKNEDEAYEKIVEMSKNNDYTTGNLLDFAYFHENYRLIAIDLSKKTNLKNRQKIVLLENSLKSPTEQQCFSSLKN